MRYCLNPHCQKIENPETYNFCANCGQKLVIGQRYVAIAPLGQGGMGRTWRGVDLTSQSPCVIKQWLPSLVTAAAITKSRELFVQEASQLKNLSGQTQIPQFIDYIEESLNEPEGNPCLYLIQEYINGKNLAQVITEHGRWQESQIIDFLQAILPVIIFLHERQIIHRDLKPENIIFCPERSFKEQYILIDFGAIKSLFNSENLALSQTITQTINGQIPTGTIIGSAEYIAPEQLRGKACFQSDIYSLGVTCLYLLTGVSPFSLYDDQLNQWRWQEFILNQSFSDPENNLLSHDSTVILNTMIANSLTQRYASAQLILDDITQISHLGKQTRTQSFNALIQQLTQALALNQWQKANQITTEILLLLCGKNTVKQIQAQDIDHLKNQELWLVEQLWAKYSRGHFGFTAQLKQWQSIGGRLFYEPDEYWRFAETYLQFSSRLQWRKWSWFPIPFLSQKWRSYDKLIFNLTAPQGHLPSFLYWEGCNITDALLAKIKQCISLFAESN